MYTLFIYELLDMMRKRWKEQQVSLDVWRKGDQKKSVEKRKEIREINWQYYGRTDEVLLGDFIFIYGETYRIKVEVQNCYNCYCEEGWKGVEKQLAYLEEQENRKVQKAQQLYEIDKREKNLQIRLLHFKKNQRELRNCIYKRIGDMVLAVFKHEEESGLCYPVLQGDKQSYQELWLNAFGTVQDKKTPCLYEMSYCRGPGNIVNNLFYGYEEGRTSLKEKNVYRLTVAERDYGAAVIFYPGIAERIAEMLQGSYYILFTDSHECFVQSRKQMPKEAVMKRRNFLVELYEKECLITEHLFWYDFLEKRIKMVE